MKQKKKENAIMLYSDLSSLAIVLVLACELHVLEALEYLLQALGRVGQHWLERHARRQLAVLGQVLNAVLQNRRNHSIVIRTLFVVAFKHSNSQSVH